ncbi:Predicted Zn-dependent peptidase [Desulfatibacillum alkenivorans DSM 16219]|uniref:Predicted Zn-dependent peptidase n=1 Tax=Desulfatibacillum alkenivorans DSM 16219 TaxID=1121393 RepID=A0A1M6EI12_9BACT|nr:pitrilysin family protein [Desulfatibacillum alkenivorans]SHI85059.1 Predicted Zn-dependent peptidase [Desulfatibacillum alkenivorans DSM 16219]
MENPVRKTELQNGIRIVTNSMPHVRSVSMGVWVNVGARDEPLENNGMCHFIEHMVFKGTEKRDAFQIAAEMDAIGGNANAFTGMEDTCYHGKVLDTHLPRLTDILSDIFLNSVFQPEEFIRERAVILQEIGMQDDSPDDRVHLMTGQALFGEHPLGRSVLGSPDNLLSFEAHSLLECLKEWYQPSRIVITAAGHLDHDDFVSLTGPAFEQVSPGPELPQRVPPKNKPELRVEHRDLEQVHLCLAASGLGAVDPRRYAYSLMNIILGGNMSSRLFQEVREKRGLAYSVYSFAPSFSDTGAIGVYAGVDPSNLDLTLNLIYKELSRLKEEKVSEQELKGAKEYVLGSLIMSAESTDNQMLRAAQNEINFGRHKPISESAKNIEAVTREQILELANELLEPPMALAVLGPVKDPDSLKRYV